MVTPQSAGPDLITVSTAAGTASFHRSARDSAELHVDYWTPELQVDLNDLGLDAAVEEVCAEEIRLMRAALHQLGDALAGQLSDVGATPDIVRRWSSQDRRTWDVGGDTLVMDPSATKLRDRLVGYEGVSDAQLVRESVRLMIDQREGNIRETYRKILPNARAKQRGTRE